MFGNLFSLENIKIMIVRLPIILFFALPMHEYAHSLVAYWFGDRTAKSQGRLTINPFAHLDPMGVLCMVFFGFGWARPVPVSPINLKHKPWSWSLVGLAGPVSNMILAFVFYLTYKLLEVFNFAFIGNEWIDLIFYVAVMVNVGLAVFNLLPIPPLDGFNVIVGFLPPKVQLFVSKYGRYMTIIFIVLLFLDVLNPILIFLQGFVFEIIQYPADWIVNLVKSI